MNQAATFDLTPDPNVLIALTHTALKPLDALCELIDNAIDSIQAANRTESVVAYPLVAVEIPTTSELNRRAGTLRVRDNGPGLTAEEAEKAIRAGYSGKNKYGNSLGLFGMGFNIATGKLGQRTTLRTARKDTEGLSVTVDLVKIAESRSFSVPVQALGDNRDFANGTEVEINSWWPDGNANHGFIRKLAAYPKDTVRSELGRRYATILRQNKIRIVVNGESCNAFEHCVWDSSRFVERANHGRIPARFDFDELVATQRRCTVCGELMTPLSDVCAACGSASFRTLEERVRGWVGIQRFDDKERYGLDLIRNGRAIRIFEQAAFFEYTDEFKNIMKDYPIDSPYGRIIGEVHLDHVPVDFLKQDFQRTGDEWRRAMEFLRGASSLQPLQPGASENTSPIFKLFQGYRKVRNYGRRDMYMGFWDGDKPARIARETEREYYQKFLQKQPGYFDDAEWWKLVEQADVAPSKALVTCTNEACQAQNLEGSEFCSVCGEILVGKDCLACNLLIPASAVLCPHCGKSQLPDIISKWTCAVCSQVNPSDAERCTKCFKARGTPSPISREFLLANSDLDDNLSSEQLSVRLADESFAALRVDTYRSRLVLRPNWEGTEVPAISFRSAAHLEIFVDTKHRVFRELELRPEHLVSSEAASYIFDMNQRLVSSQPAMHSIPTLTMAVLEKRFAAVLEDSAELCRAGLGPC